MQRLLTIKKQIKLYNNQIEKIHKLYLDITNEMQSIIDGYTFHNIGIDYDRFAKLLNYENRINKLSADKKFKLWKLKHHYTVWDKAFLGHKDLKNLKINKQKLEKRCRKNLKYRGNLFSWEEL